MHRAGGDEVSVRDHLENDRALTRPELQRFVDAARGQQIAQTCVTAESVQAGLEHNRRRSHAQRMLWLSGAVAIAASISVFALVAPLWSQSDGEAPNGAGSRDGVAGEPIATAPETVPLRVETPTRTLEVVEGRATIEVAPHGTAVKLHTGVAAWIDADGTRTPIEVEHSQIDVDSAAALAREAERLLVAGQREQAIETLRRLVERYPHASQTRAAVLDLARLLAAAKRERHARCAYELYLERWPDSSVAAEVRAQLARLSKAECRGLEPR